MTQKQQTQLRNSIKFWTSRALTAERIGNRNMNIKYTARANALREKLSSAIVADRMAETHSAAFVRQFRVIA